MRVKNFKNILKVLIKNKKADLTILNKNGANVLHYLSMEMGYLKIIIFLLEEMNMDLSKKRF